MTLTPSSGIWVVVFCLTLFFLSLRLRCGFVGGPWMPLMWSQSARLFFCFDEATKSQCGLICNYNFFFHSHTFIIIVCKCQKVKWMTCLWEMQNGGVQNLFANVRWLVRLYACNLGECALMRLVRRWLVIQYRHTNGMSDSFSLPLWTFELRVKMVQQVFHYPFRV